MEQAGAKMSDGAKCVVSSLKVEQHRVPRLGPLTWEEARGIDREIDTLRELVLEQAGHRAPEGAAAARLDMAIAALDDLGQALRGSQLELEQVQRLVKTGLEVLEVACMCIVPAPSETVCTEEQRERFDRIRAIATTVRPPVRIPINLPLSREQLEQLGESIASELEDPEPPASDDTADSVICSLLERGDVQRIEWEREGDTDGARGTVYSGVERIVVELTGCRA